MISLPSAPSHDTDASQDRRAGRISTTLFRFFSDLIRALNNRTVISGTVDFSAATTAAVTFSVAEPSADYRVTFSAADDNYHWATSLTVNGFTANAKNSTSATVGWHIHRL